MKGRSRRTNATRRANADLGLYIHLAVFVVVNALLIFINLATSPDHHWFWWPLRGWSIGLGLHAFLLLVIPRAAAMRRGMIAKELKNG